MGANMHAGGGGGMGGGGMGGSSSMLADPAYQSGKPELGKREVQVFNQS